MSEELRERVVDGERWPAAAALIVRSRTHDEQVELAAILEPLHAHVENCANCRAGAAVCDSAADFGPTGMCEAGRTLYARWIRWLAG